MFQRKLQATPRKHYGYPEKNLDCVYGLRKLSKQTNRHCSFVIRGNDFKGFHRFKKVFNGVSHIGWRRDRTLDYQALGWLHFLIISQHRRLSKNYTKKKPNKIPWKLQNAAYRTSEIKDSDFFERKRTIVWKKIMKVKNWTEQMQKLI